MSGRRDRHAVSPSRPVIALAVLFVLVVVLVGGRRLGAGLRGVAAVWRPTTGLLSVVVMMAAAVLAIREDWWIAVLLAVLAGALALGARKRKALTPATDAMSPAEARAILGAGRRRWGSDRRRLPPPDPLCPSRSGRHRGAGVPAQRRARHASARLNP